MTFRPQRRKTVIVVGAAMALAMILAVAILGSNIGERSHPALQQSWGEIRPDGKLVLRIAAPKLY